MIAFVITCVLLTLASFFNYLPNVSWVQEVNRHLSVYYFFFHLLFVSTIILVRRRLNSGLMLVLMLSQLILVSLHLRVLAPYYVKGGFDHERDHDHGKEIEVQTEFSLLLVRFTKKGPNSETLENLVKDHSPDLIGISNVKKEASDLPYLHSSHPHVVQSFDENTNVGAELYSAFPFVGEADTWIGQYLPPVVIQKLLVSPGKVLKFGLLQGMSVYSSSDYHENRILFRRVATLFRHEELPSIVGGSFQSTPFSRFYKIVELGAEMEDVSHGQGLHRTWNMNSPFARLTLDHVLYKGDVEVSDLQYLKVKPWSHAAILVRFKV